MAAKRPSKPAKKAGAKSVTKAGIKANTQADAAAALPRRETVAEVLAQVNRVRDEPRDMSTAEPGVSGDGKSGALVQRGAGGRFVAGNKVFRSSEELKVEVHPEPVARSRAATSGVAARSVEARAEEEPAVVVSEALMAVPSRVTLWQRVWAWRRQARVEETERKAAMASHMAAVKAGVLQELESIGAKKGLAIKGSPFASVVLPVQPRRASRRWLWAAAAVVVLTGVMAWVASREVSPARTLAELHHALVARDAEGVVRRVDLPAVASSLVNQMFSLPPRDVLAVHAALLVKPGMVLELQRDMLAAVRGDAMGTETLPWRLYGLLGADNLRIGAANVRMQDAREAVAEVPVTRKDLGITLPLQVVLEQRDGAWVVVNIPNFVHVLSGIVQADAAAVATRGGREPGAAPDVAAEAVRPVLEAGRVDVESLAKPESRGANMLLRARVANRSEARVSDARLVVEFGDAAQKPLLTLQLPLDGTMLPDEVREQVWSVPVDSTEPHAGTVARLPLGAMSVTATVVY